MRRKNWKPQHDQFLMEMGDKRFLVDIRLHRIIKLLWKHGVETLYSCQGGKNTTGYISVKESFISLVLWHHFLDNADLTLYLERAVYDPEDPRLVVRFYPGDVDRLETLISNCFAHQQHIKASS